MAVLKKTTDTEEPAEKKTAVKKTASKKAAASEKTAAKKTAAAEKTSARKTTAKKTSSVKKLIDDAKEAAPKTTKKRTAKKKEPKVEIIIEYAGKQVKAEDVIADITEAYTNANPDSAVETLEIYIQPETNRAYYVVNSDFWKSTSVEI